MTQTTEKDCYGYARIPERNEKVEYGRFRNVYLYITHHCQLHCGHCYMGKRLATKIVMPKEKVFSTLQFWRKMGGRKLSLLGGEPTLHPDFIEICRYAKSLGYEKVIVNTNGLKQTIKQFDQLEPSEITYVQVSLDGGSALTHDAIRGQGTFAITLNTTQTLAKRGFDTRVICTVNKKNREDCLNLIDICEKANVSLLKFHIFSTIGTGLKNEEWGLTPNEWIDFYTSLKNRKNHHKLQIWYQPTYATKSTVLKYISEGYKGCIGRTLDRISIFPDGKAYVCSFLFDTDLNMFNIIDNTLQLNRERNEFELFCNCLNQKESTNLNSDCLGGCPAEELLCKNSQMKNDEIISVCRLWKSDV